MGYICCLSYGRPRSKDYHFKHYKELLEKTGLPHIRFHDLRKTYATLLMKNNINQKAVATALGHAKSIITVDIYTDMQAIIGDCVDELQEFISEVHPYDYTDRTLLWEMFQEVIEVQEGGTEEVEKMEERKEEKTQASIVYDYSDATELSDINEWFAGEGERKAALLFWLKGGAEKFLDID